MSTKLSGQVSGFDFPKSRKRWPEILLTELTDAIVLLLSPRGKIIYCGTAVQDILGWKDSEVVAMDSIRDLVCEEDFTSFLDAFRAAIQTDSEMVTYTQLKSKPPLNTPLPNLTYPAQHVLNFQEHNPMLFEIKGYPHFSDSGPQGFFAFCLPYPRKSNAMLNGFLELKLENERLKERVKFLRSRLPSDYANMRISPTNSPTRSTFPFTQSATSSESTKNLDNIPVIIQEEEDLSLEDGAPKRKRRNRQADEQHVCATCGRTDSPEWRKGPLGPKTLCNACGLRWSKQAKKNTQDGG